MTIIESNFPEGRTGKYVQYKSRGIFRENCLIKSYMTLQLYRSETITTYKIQNPREREVLWAHDTMVPKSKQWISRKKLKIINRSKFCFVQPGILS